MESLSIEELAEVVDKTPDLDLAGRTVYSAVLETLSGKKVLAVKFQDLNIYSQGDGSYAVFFFAEEEGQLSLTYAYDSWARKYVELSERGTMEMTGSNGAGDSVSEQGYLDESGHYRQIYSMEVLSEDWVAMYRMDNGGDDDWDTAWSRGCTCTLLQTPEGGFYVMEAQDTVDREKLASFLSYLEELGMSPAQSVEEEIDRAYGARGIANETWAPAEMWRKVEGLEG